MSPRFLAVSTFLVPRYTYRLSIPFSPLLNTHFGCHHVRYLRTEIGIALGTEHMPEFPKVRRLLRNVQRNDTREHDMNTCKHLRAYPWYYFLCVTYHVGDGNTIRRLHRPSRHRVYQWSGPVYAENSGISPIAVDRKTQRTVDALRLTTADQESAIHQMMSCMREQTFSIRLNSLSSFFNRACLGFSG